MEALLVTAYVRHSIEQPHQWGPDLAGILESMWFRRELGPDFYTYDFGDDEHANMEVGREYHGDTWWWQCSSPIIPGHHEQFEQWVHRRFDVGRAIDGGVSAKVKSVLTAGGAYKSSRDRHMMVLTDRLQWHVIGDATEVADLVSRCHHIGGGRARGNGSVRGWTVAPDGDPDIARFHRPIPVAFANEHGVAGPQRMWRILPPGWKGTGHVLAVMP